MPEGFFPSRGRADTSPRMTDDTHPDPDLLAKIAAGSARVERLEHGGKTLWVKRSEQLRGKLRIYKGDPARAFCAERDALLALSGRGLPVAEIVASGEDFIVTEAAGKSLKHLLRFEEHPTSERIIFMQAAARGLAALHTAGFSHGRPNLKDILWDGQAIRFIDFERAAPHRNNARGHTEDVILFFFSAFAEVGDMEVIDAARVAYLESGGAPFWNMAAKRMKRLRWAYWLSRLAVPFLGRGRDFRAIKPTFAYFRSFASDG